MKTLGIGVILTILLSFLFIFRINALAQSSSCATVTSIATSAQSVQGGTQFTCSVTVSSQFANSSSIACGVSVNGQFPSNVCPSDTAFGGWNGSTALFNCTLPSLNLSQINTIEAVGYDFSQNCGPQTGKRISLSFTKPTPSDSQPTSAPDNTLQPLPSNLPAPWNTPSPAPTTSPLDKTTQPFQNLLELLFGFAKNPAKPGSDPANTDNPPSGIQLSPTPNPITDTVPNGTFTNLDELFEYVGNKVGVPACLLSGVAHIEFGSIFTYAPNEIVAGSVPGQTMRNCQATFNSCGAKGIMQILTSTDHTGSPSCSQCPWNRSTCLDVWSGYANTVNEFEGTNHIPSYCNIKDDVYAAAKKLKSDSASKFGTQPWSSARLDYAATRYFGSCDYAVRDGKTYCQIVTSYCSL